LEEPQAPSIMVLAEQMGERPPYEPVHSQVQGPEPETAEGEPLEQRFSVGAVYEEVPFEEPQVPSRGTPPVEQEAESPPYCPAQVQVQGPLPETEDAVPVAQRLVEGIEERLAPLEEPQAPSLGSSEVKRLVSLSYVYAYPEERTEEMEKEEPSDW